MPSDIAYRPSATPWRLVYHDGNGNGYLFRQENSNTEARFSFTPVTATASSSGLYSGGKPAEGPLSDAQAEALWRSAHHLAKRTAKYTNFRPKGAGAFRLETPNRVQSFTIKSGPELNTFEALLAPFRNR